MARSDSFFIRAELTLDPTSTFTSTTVDLGSFVDALGKTVLRIHNASIQYDHGTSGIPTLAGANSEGVTAWQLTTQSQVAMLRAANRSVISTGSLLAINDTAVTNSLSSVTHDMDVAPQTWTNGYLVAVESLQFAGDHSNSFVNPCTVSLVLECTVETMTAAASMALALSQQ